MDEQIFARGDRVEKRSGYRFPGIVRAAFTTISGEWRYVVEADNDDFAGMLHIYSASQLILAPKHKIPTAQLHIGHPVYTEELKVK